MKYFISDTHFFHPVVILSQRSQFKTIYEMNESICDIWCSTVKPEDTVYHLGDFAFGSDFDKIEELVKKLPGKVVLVLGNHDSPIKVKLYSQYFKLASSVYLDDMVLTHAPIHPDMLREIQRTNGVIELKNVHGHMHHHSIQDPRYLNINWDVLLNKKMLSLVEVKDLLRRDLNERPVLL